LSYCDRESGYLAHQITAPQIAGPKAILAARDLLRKKVIDVNTMDSAEIADRNFSRVIKVLGR
jgi:hypothetical protein